MGKGKHKITGLDRFHYHEAQDRAYMIGNMINEYLTEHPVIMKHKKLRKLVKQAEKNIFNVYNAMTSYDQKIFPDQTDGSEKQ
jgi:hypothetical protein